MVVNGRWRLQRKCGRRVDTGAQSITPLHCCGPLRLRPQLAEVDRGRQPDSRIDQDLFQDPRWTRVSFGRIVNEEALEPAGRHARDLFSAGRAHRDNARCHRYVMWRHPEDTKRAEFRWYPKTSGHGFTGCRWSGRAETSDWSVSGGHLTGFDHCIEALQPALRQCSHQTQDFTRLPSRVRLSMRTTNLEGPVLASLRRARRPG